MERNSLADSRAPVMENPTMLESISKYPNGIPNCTKNTPTALSSADETVSLTLIMDPPRSS